MTKREFLAAGLGAGFTSAAFAQHPAKAAAKAPTRMAKTTKLFKSPQGFPNAVSVTPEGLWIAEQKLSGAQAASYKLPEPKDLTELTTMLRDVVKRAWS